ncbi:LOW QUALITY PROTEIN: hypothetical protein PFAG_06111 [Plasmodium falciparum Santa Lucia]|uniref:Uncharacterized protein n=2 Tax=Plasmodium falciparum TaxID=5833 RepID=W7F903_PLAF8|nr:LOW QUALITY PROTEIN: hypothetical protein PFBG_02318 [Plasmodium falciparum 7G8]EUT67298.1 LOW QUALITY PROTEIN: hypothetical protein PFAG_06111 [Plasmodium falciparum Santa Lucia]
MLNKRKLKQCININNFIVKFLFIFKKYIFMEKINISNIKCIISVCSIIRKSFKLYSCDNSIFLMYTKIIFYN